MNTKNIYRISLVVALALISAALFFLCGKSKKEKALKEIARFDWKLTELIGKGANVNEKNEHGVTALM